MAEFVKLGPEQEFVGEQVSSRIPQSNSTDLWIKNRGFFDRIKDSFGASFAA